MQKRPRTVPRKKARQARSEATVDAILAATARVLVREGYDRASTNRIALAAGVSIGSLYQYFPSKEALVAALIDRHAEAMIAVLDGSFAQAATKPLRECARIMVQALIEAHRIDPPLHKVLMEQVPRVGRLDRMNTVAKRGEELVRLYLQANRGSLRPHDADLVAFVVVNAVEALTHAAVVERPEYLGSEAFVEEMTELIVRYLSLGAEAAGS
jgi:AcrR family transcriptional regulator